MNNNTVKFVCALWVSAIILICTRYLCASIMVAGSLCDQETYRTALDSLGPFLPVMSTVCLAGGLIFLLTELFIQLRNRKK